MFYIPGTFQVATRWLSGQRLIAVSEKIIPQNIRKKYFPMISASKSQLSRGKYRPDICQFWHTTIKACKSTPKSALICVRIAKILRSLR